MKDDEGHCAVTPSLARISLIALLTAFFALSSCANRDVVKVRTQSPDGRVDAFLVERETGATVATPMLVYIAKAGEAVSSNDLVLRGDNFEGLSIKWTEPKLLSVRYKKGRIFTFTNFWKSPGLDNWSYVVEIRLEPTNPRSLD